jgi:hypothetical protein
LGEAALQPVEATDVNIVVRIKNRKGELGFCCICFSQLEIGLLCLELLIE